MRFGKANLVNVSFLVFISLNFVKAQISFSDSASGFGINVNCGDTYLGNGISFFDYDNDGWDDLSIGTVDGEPVRFFKNINGNFVEQNLNIGENNWQNKQINWVDIDNDGDNDLFVTSDDDGNKLFENLGNMIMQDITESCGMLPDNFPYYGASWGDYNNDGFLDVFLSIRDVNIPNILYKNNGDKTFTLVNSEAGLLNTGFMSFCSAFLDYNNDGFQDIYVSNDKYANPNLLYKNNGDGTFTELGAQSGTNIFIDAMTVTVDDVNDDGWLDIYVTNGTEDSVLFINNQNGTFSDLTVQYQVTFNSIGWGAVFLDADNDTDLDLYVSGETTGSNPQYLSSAFYNNIGNGSFQLNNSAIPSDFSHSYSNALGDCDNDGYPEIVVNHITNSNISLWKNNTDQINNWLKVNLEGTISNNNGIGSFIEISINGEKQYRYTLCGEGYLGQNSGTEIFGLGDATTVDYVKVKWLSGIEDIIYNVNSNQTLNIVENTTLSISENDTYQTFVYPNPVNDILNLNVSNPIIDIEILNIIGQSVLKTRQKVVDNKLDISDLISGTYLIVLKTEGGNMICRFLKK